MSSSENDNFLDRMYLHLDENKRLLSLIVFFLISGNVPMAAKVMEDSSLYFQIFHIKFHLMPVILNR